MNPPIPLLAGLLLALLTTIPCRSTPQGTATTIAPTPTQPAPAQSPHPWLLPAATLEESMAHLGLHASLQTYEKILQQQTETSVEIGMAKVRALEDTDPEMIALKAKLEGLDWAATRLSNDLTNMRNYIERQRATWLAEQDRRRAEAAAK